MFQYEHTVAMMIPEAINPLNSSATPPRSGVPLPASGRPLSVRAFALAADTSPRRIRRLIRQGRIETTENQAGEIRIAESELGRLQTWREARMHRRSLESSMELSVVSMELEPRIAKREAPAYEMQVPLSRHEATMMRLGYVEAELSELRTRLHDREGREQDYLERAVKAEQEVLCAQAKTREADARLDEMRSQVIDCTFKAVELQDEVVRLQDKLMASWWSRLLESLAARKDKSGGAK
jgi:hypothetical protein